MGTSKGVAILLLAVLTGMVAAGQDPSASSAPASQFRSSNTRTASGIVRIAVDPEIMPLTAETVASLVHSPGVLGRAGRDILSLHTAEDLDRLSQPQDSGRPLIMIRWLAPSSAAMPAAGRSRPQPLGYDEHARRQLEAMYGREHMQQMTGMPNKENKGAAQEGRSEDNGRGEGRSGTYGTAAGGAVGGMGGMGMVGGAMSAQATASPSHGPIERVPGESDLAYRTRVAQIRARQAALEGMKTRGMEGMGGLGFSYGASGATPAGAGAAPSATVELQVHLPDPVPPRADEFLRAVVGNLQDNLIQAYEAHVADLRHWLGDAREQRRATEAASDDAGEDSPAIHRLKQQLESEVDLSQWQPRMPLSEAVNVLRRSVEPPLNIVVLWRDIAESPINIDGMPRTRLGTALDLLVRGLPARDVKPLWRIKDDTVVIGTTATLGQSPEAVGAPSVETDAVNLAGHRSELTRKMQVLELDLAGLDARQKAIQEQIAATKQMAKTRLAEDSVTRELEQLQHTSAINLANLKKAADAGRVAAPDLAQAQESAARIRIDLARRQEELTRVAGGSQLEEFTRELSRLTIDKAEKEAQLRIVSRQLDQVQRQLMQALAFDPEAARLRLAREVLDITGRRVAELQTRLANLQPPMVTTIGAN